MGKARKVHFFVSGIKRVKGIILILALFTIAILAPIAVSYHTLILSNTVRAVVAGNRAQARKLAEAGIQAAIELLKSDSRNTDSLHDNWAQPIPVYPLEVGDLTIEITDEDRKLNVNQMLEVIHDEINPVVKARYELLFKNNGYDRTLLESLADWLDTDSVPRPYGVEDAYYQSMNPPYIAHNSWLRGIESLLLIKGFKPDILYGKDSMPGLADWLTCYSNGKVNINTAPYQVLMALDQEMTPTITENLVYLRQRSPFKDIGGFYALDWIPDGAKDGVSVKSSYFRIISKGETTHSNVTLIALVKREMGRIKLVLVRER